MASLEMDIEEINESIEKLPKGKSRMVYNLTLLEANSLIDKFKGKDYFINKPSEFKDIYTFESPERKYFLLITRIGSVQNA